MNRGTFPKLACLVLVGLMAGWLPTSPLAADEAADKPEHKVKVDLRYRFETVDQAVFDRDASASTLRTALSYRSPQWRGWSLFLQAENVAPIFDDDSYNNAGRDGNSNGVSGRPVVADPALTDMNQAYLRWQGEVVTATLGRQEINVGDQRFVGAVGWRQNHQSFDAVRLQWSATPRIDIDYAYVRDVHRIFGDRLDASHHLLTVPFRWGTDDLGGTVTAYGYLLDWEFPTVASTLTAGVEWKGSAGHWHWELEAAQQEDSADNPIEIDSGYLRAEGGAGWTVGAAKLGLSFDWESLEGGEGRSFQTPLATLHKWNGWADLFLTTPTIGLETTTLRFTGSFNGKSGSWSWIVAWLDHQAEFASIDFGTEIDGQLTWKSDWGQAFALKFADYDADRFGSDVTKAMFFTTYSFGH